MNKAEEHELKKEFQLERIILFSDAVFAIIITIMVLEIKLPEGIQKADFEHVKEAYTQLIPKFASYLLSFWFVSRFWIRHLKIFSFLKDYDNGLLMRNLFFLFSMSMFPFACALLADSSRVDLPQYGWAVNIYIIALLFCTFMQTLLVGYLVKYKEQLCFSTDVIEYKLRWKALKTNLYLIPTCVAILIVLNIFSLPAYLGFILLLLYVMIFKRITNHKYPNAHDEKATEDRLPFKRVRTNRKKVVKSE